MTDNTITNFVTMCRNDLVAEQIYRRFKESNKYKLLKQELLSKLKVFKNFKFNLHEPQSCGNNMFSIIIGKKDNKLNALVVVPIKFKKCLNDLSFQKY